MKSGITEELGQAVADAAKRSASPERAARALWRVLEESDRPELFRPHLPEAARLLALSQFLANHSARRPADLLHSLNAMKEPISRAGLRKAAEEELSLPPEATAEAAMWAIRDFKKRHLLTLSLRFACGLTDVNASMQELSALAEAVLESTLRWSLASVALRFGEPPEGASMALVAFGKLGGEELNYSSDVDLMAVYPPGEGATTGTLGPTGVNFNRISTHEFYCKAVELLSKTLSAQTEDGVAYRVDLRLRPQGSRGEIAWPLDAYRTYYESWGRTWERMALIRARHVAGDADLGRAFIDVITPFVWRSPADYAEIEEIKALKKTIDSTQLRDDIKRGYGGIREAEFFVQTFQLIYGVEHRALRTYRMFHALQGLRRMALLPERDVLDLWESYVYLRKLEHMLQMRDDLQTYTLPKGDAETLTLARAMGFADAAEFASETRLRRMKIKNMYNSLLGSEEDRHAEAMALLEGGLSTGELEGYMSFRGAADTASAVTSVKGLQKAMREMRTQEERTQMRKVLPPLVEAALESPWPERALAGLDTMFGSFGVRAAHIAALGSMPQLRAGAVMLLAMSSTLTRLFVSGDEHLNRLIEDMPIRKSLARISREMARTRADGTWLHSYRNTEWIRLGMLFLGRIMDGHSLQRYLSHLADAVLEAALGEALDAKGLPPGTPFSVIAMGKHGARELAYGSDLDIIFVSGSHEAQAVAEAVIKRLTEYTALGQLYEVDARLRPDGSKGTLVKDMEGMRNYYLNSAHPWEVQALLRARPAAGSAKVGREFFALSREAIAKRHGELTRESIKEMRARIMRELSRQDKGMDLKHGPGGIGEVEFLVQWLQISRAASHPRALVQNTLSAIGRLGRAGALSPQHAEDLGAAYAFMRNLQIILRLNGEEVLRPDTRSAQAAAAFMGLGSAEELAERVSALRRQVQAISEAC